MKKDSHLSLSPLQSSTLTHECVSPLNEADIIASTKKNESEDSKENEQTLLDINLDFFQNPFFDTLFERLNLEKNENTRTTLPQESACKQDYKKKPTHPVTDESDDSCNCCFKQFFSR